MKIVLFLCKVFSKKIIKTFFIKVLSEMKLKVGVFVAVFHEAIKSKVKLSQDETINRCLEYLETLNIKTLSRQSQSLKTQLEILLKVFKRHWMKYKRTWMLIENNQSEWLNSEFDFDFKEAQKKYHSQHPVEDDHLSHFISRN
jgi:hypothetical protein